MAVHLTGDLTVNGYWVFAVFDGKRSKCVGSGRLTFVNLNSHLVNTTSTGF